MSYAIAQSVKLDQFEFEVNGVIDENEQLPYNLAINGTTMMHHNELLQRYV